LAILMERVLNAHRIMRVQTIISQGLFGLSPG
jgi:hypothetical protein